MRLELSITILFPSYTLDKIFSIPLKFETLQTFYKTNPLEVKLQEANSKLSKESYI